jgi:hypothetical protein
MMTLLCFCCEHRNPAGARFCNACGTPLHLKPCKRCETINERAAAHCHRCGETFELEFVTLDEAAQLSGADIAPLPAASTVDSGPEGTPARRVRVYLLAAGIAMAAITATWFGARLSEPSEAAIAATPSVPAPGAHASLPGDEPAPVRAASAVEAIPEPGDAPADRPEESDDASDAAPSAAAATVRAEPAVVAPLSPPRAVVARPQAVSRDPRANGRPTPRDTRPRSATAGEPPAGGEPSRAPMIMAVERPSAAAPRRALSERNVAPRKRGVVRVEPGTPCSEGYAPAPGCDFRAMPKGN